MHRFGIGSQVIAGRLGATKAMKTSSVSLLLCAVISLAGCASRPKANQNFDGAYIDYSLPFTSV